MPITQVRGASLWMGAWYGHGTLSVTVQVRNQDAFAEIALTEVFKAETEIFQAHAFISQIVSDSGVENFKFEDFRHVVFRRNVTSISFTVSASGCRGTARWIIFS
jgi:hypothetical protein